MSDVRVSPYIMEQLGYGQLTYTLPQMIVGAIVTDMDERGFLDLDRMGKDYVQEMGEDLADLARRTMAGDGNVNTSPPTATDQAIKDSGAE